MDVLVALLEGDPVPHAQSAGEAYGMRDDQGVGLDALEVVELLAHEIDAIGGDMPRARWFGGYHHHQGNDRFEFRVALAETLLGPWRWVSTVDKNWASQPSFYRLETGQLLVTYEKSGVISKLLPWARFCLYESVNAVMAGLDPIRMVDMPHLGPEIAVCEGTPTVRHVEIRDGQMHVYFAFHYNVSSASGDVTRDLNAVGMFTDFEAQSFRWCRNYEINETLTHVHGVRDNIGDRSSITMFGRDFYKPAVVTIVEGREVKDNWTTWRCYAVQEPSATADALHRKVALRTPNGNPAFGNPALKAFPQRDVEGNRYALVVFTAMVFTPGADGGQCIRTWRVERPSPLSLVRVGALVNYQPFLQLSSSITLRVFDT
jgi:hypothetical protein